MSPDVQGKPVDDGAVFRQLEAVSLTEGVVAALKDASYRAATARERLQKLNRP